MSYYYGQAWHCRLRLHTVVDTCFVVGVHSTCSEGGSKGGWESGREGDSTLHEMEGNVILRVQRDCMKKLIIEYRLNTPTCTALTTIVTLNFTLTQHYLFQYNYSVVVCVAWNRSDPSLLQAAKPIMPFLPSVLWYFMIVLFACQLVLSFARDFIFPHAH